jgi:hypothetical protein
VISDHPEVSLIILFSSPNRNVISPKNVTTSYGTRPTANFLIRLTVTVEFHHSDIHEEFLREETL